MIDNNYYNDPNVVQNIEEIFLLIIECDHEDVDEYIEAISEILDEGNIDINTKYDYNSWTYGGDWDNFLKTAVQMNIPEIIQLLLDRGININITDSGGLTPLDILNREFEDHGHMLTPYGLQKYMDTRDILLENGAMTKEQIRIIVARNIQRRRRKNLTHRRAKRNLAFSKSFRDQSIRRKPENLSELAPDLLEKISTYTR